MATAYLWHNYGKTTIGARSDIENVPIDRLQAFYKRYYQPDNAVLLVAGKFDEAEDARARSQALLARSPRPTRTLERIYTTEPTQDGERSVTLRRVGDTQLVGGRLPRALGCPRGLRGRSTSLAQVLGDTPSGRLHKALVESKKASSVFGFNFQWREPTIAILAAEVRDRQLAGRGARRAAGNDRRARRAAPPTKEEVERARAQLLKNIELNLNRSDTIGLTLERVHRRRRLASVFPASRSAAQGHVERGRQAAAAKYFKPSNRTLGLFIPTQKPDRAEIPATPDVAALLKDYKGDAAIAAGEAFDPSPANIETRTSRNAAPSGLTLALLPKKTRGGTVVAQLDAAVWGRKEPDESRRVSPHSPARC